MFLAYLQHVWMPDGWPYQQVWVSLRLCSDMANTVEALFRRLFDAAGFSEQNAEFV